MTNDFLFELGTEELPSGAVLPLALACAEGFKKALQAAQLTHGDIQHYATPRRIAVWVRALQAEQAPQTVTRRGPAASQAHTSEGKPSPALLGFAKSCGVPIDNLQLTETDKGAWWQYQATQPGVKTTTLLPGLIKQVVAELPMSKPMRWGTGQSAFLRPVHWILCLFGDDTVDCQLFGIQSGRETYGHRFHAPKALPISSASTYADSLQQQYVLVDFEHRRQCIAQQIEQIATEHGYAAHVPADLLDEVTSIVEWPQALLVPFDPMFLSVPKEALMASMQSHQKCFSLHAPKTGELVPYFITVANIASRHPEQVIAGNSKVMHARLSDAAFFFHQDSKRALASYEASTAAVIFQEKLGSLQAKSRRLQHLMKQWAERFQYDTEQGQRAAFLSKCDLMTGMVGEFPELQGLMGYYYAQQAGETLNVAQALNEQYQPRFAQDHLPQTMIGKVLSLADRLDTLCGLFAIQQKPTGVKDPFKLRRHALAVVRILMSITTPCQITTLIDDALHTYDASWGQSPTIRTEVHHFILDRLEAYYLNQNISADVVQAVRAQQDSWLFDLDQRIQALVRFMQQPEAILLAAICKRVRNLLQHAPLDTHATQTIDQTLLVEPAEKALLQQIEQTEAQVEPLYLQGEYDAILTTLAHLNTAIDDFFAHVMVMVEDTRLKANRLCLLARLQQVLQGVADFSLLR